jgi:hypothetical protein
MWLKPGDEILSSTLCLHMYLMFFFFTIGSENNGTLQCSWLCDCEPPWRLLFLSLSLLRSRSVPLLISDVSRIVILRPHFHARRLSVWVAAVCIASIERQESNQLLECTAAARINHWKSPVLSAAAHLARLQYYRWMICTLRRIQTTLAMIDSLNRGGSGKFHRYSNLCFPSVASASRKS